MLGVIIGVMARDPARIHRARVRRCTLPRTYRPSHEPPYYHSGKTSTRGGFHPPSAGTVRKLTYDDALALRRRAWILTDCGPARVRTGKIKYRNMGRDTMVIGTTPEFQR